MKAEFTLEEGPAPASGPSEVRVLRVGGEIDTTNAAEFEEAVIGRSSPGRLVLDLTSVLYCDSAAFAALDRVLAQGRTAVALGGDNPVRRAASIMGLAFHDTVELAVRSLAG